MPFHNVSKYMPFHNVSKYMPFHNMGKYMPFHNMGKYMPFHNMGKYMPFHNVGKYMHSTFQHLADHAYTLVHKIKDNVCGARFVNNLGSRQDTQSINSPNKMLLGRS